MDMFFPNIPIQQGHTSNYVSPLKHGTSPSANEAQNALNMEKTSMVPDDEAVARQRLERANEDERREKKKRKKSQDCQTCKKRQGGSSYLRQGESLGQDREDSRESGQAEERGLAPPHSCAAEGTPGAGRDVIGQNLVFHYEICPECGRPYMPVGPASQITRAASQMEMLRARYRAGIDLLPQGINVNDEA